MSDQTIYKKPVGLSRENHKLLKLKPMENLEFTKGINSVPITGIEFFEASRDLPILFRRSDTGALFPLALLSLSNEGHFQLDDSGRWTGNYVPAFIRRYPFALTAEGQVCFDEDSGLFSEEEGEALFTEDGKNSDMLEKAITFLRRNKEESDRTRDFCTALGELDLVEPFDIKLVKEGSKPLRLEGLLVISEKKLAKALDEGSCFDWFRKGWLAWTYAHLHSLGALRRLKREA